MQIIPTVLSLLFVISVIAYHLTQDFRVANVEVKHFTARYAAERKMRNTKTGNFFMTFKENTPAQETKEGHFFPRKTQKIFQPHSLSPLLENVHSPKLHSFFEKLFLYLYHPITFEGKPVPEKELVETFRAIIATAKEFKRAQKPLEWEKLLEHSPLKEKFLEGTHRITFFQRKGYPPIDTAFSFDETNTPIAFSGLPEDALYLLFSESEVALILEKEQEQNKGYPLSLKALETLLPSHEMLKYLHYKRQKKKGLIASDDKKIIELHSN